MTDQILQLPRQNGIWPNDQLTKVLGARFSSGKNVAMTQPIFVVDVLMSLTKKC